VEETDGRLRPGAPVYALGLRGRPLHESSDEPLRWKLSRERPNGGDDGDAVGNRRSLSVGVKVTVEEYSSTGTPDSIRYE